MRIYIDTSVFGGCFEDEFREWSEILFEEIFAGKKTAVISDVTLGELERAPVFVRSLFRKIPESSKEIYLLDEETVELSNHYLTEKIVTKKSFQDTRHIAIASVARVDLMVSWNFKHIVNYKLIRLYNSVNMKFGYPVLDIRTPREVIEPK